MPEEVITRREVVQKIRTKLIELTDGGKTSACEVAKERNIFCRGLHGIDDATFARQRADGWMLPCDMQYACWGECRAWDDFTNAQLAEFCREMFGESVRVTGVMERPLL